MAEDWDPIWVGPRTGPAWLDYCNGHPAAVLSGLEALSAGADEMVFRLESGPLLNPNGGVHGGMLATALDHVLGTTAMLAMPEDGLPNTAGMNVQYLRPAMPPLAIRGWVSRGGRTLVFVRADVVAHDGKLCATCDGTFAVVDARKVNARESA